MQVHLDIQDGREAGRRFMHVGKLGRLVDRERVGASKLDEEQVVLSEVVTKRRFGERAVCQSVREGMFGVSPPLRDASVFRRSKKLTIYFAWLAFP